MQSQFEAGCRRPAPEGPGFSQEQAHTLWEQVLAFAGYGFNRGHATAYADVSYRSAYLKRHWPAAFFAARLADWGGFHHPAIYMAEAVRLGIPVLPPHINHSQRTFSLSFVASNQSPVLYMGLGQVRDLRRNSVKQIIAARDERPFESLQDLVGRVQLQSKELRHLVQCGALDGLGDNRATLLSEAELTGRAGSARQMSFEFALAPAVSESAVDRFEWERRLLGQPVSVHPLELINDLPQTKALADLAEPGTGPSRRLVTVAGTRLPGWTGGPGFFLGDGRDFVIVQGDDEAQKPEPWLPLLLRGRWRNDEWGSGWLQVEEMRLLS